MNFPIYSQLQVTMLGHPPLKKIQNLRANIQLRIEKEKRDANEITKRNF